MFLAYKDKKKWIKTVRNAVCFIKILDSICCNALVKRDRKQQKDERNSVMSLLFTQCNNTGTDIIGFQITVFISYKQTRVTQPPRYTITFLGSHHSSQMPLKELKMLPNFSKLSTCLASGHLDVTTNRIHFINKIPQMKSEDCFIFFHKLCCPMAITKAWRSQVPIYGEACKGTN